MKSALVWTLKYEVTCFVVIFLFRWKEARRWCCSAEFCNQRAPEGELGISLPSRGMLGIGTDAVNHWNGYT